MSEHGRENSGNDWYSDGEDDIEIEGEDYIYIYMEGMDIF